MVKSRALTVVGGTSVIDWQSWAKRINGAWQKSVASIIETGRLLNEAKADPNLPHGSFKAMVQTKLNFSPRTANMLMKIARNQVLIKENHGSLLPPSWRTLFELTKLPEATLVEKIRDHTIHPKMERKDVAVILNGGNPKPKKKKERKPSSKPEPRQHDPTMTLDAARKAHALAAKDLTLEQKKAELLRTADLFGVDGKDFISASIDISHARQKRKGK